MQDYLLSVSTQEVVDELEIDEIKRELNHMVPWLSDYCKDSKLMKREFLSAETIRLIRYFTRALQEDRTDIHDFTSCTLLKVDSYSIQIRFNAYRD